MQVARRGFELEEECGNSSFRKAMIHGLKVWIIMLVDNFGSLILILELQKSELKLKIIETSLRKAVS